MSVTDPDKEKMRELRKQGLSIRRIAEMTGSSESTVYKFTKDVIVPVGVYEKELL
jgi:transposase